MQKTIQAAMLFVLFLLVPRCAAAQNPAIPHVQLFGGYAYIRPSVLAHQFSAATEQGWDTSITDNVNDWLAIVGDASGRYGSRITTGPVVGPAGFKRLTRPYIYSLVAGPQLAWHVGRTAAFAHGFVGLARERSTMNGVDFISARVDTGVATIVGGGVDVSITPRVAVRMVEADYLRTVVFSQTQSSFALSSGVTFGFGSR